MEHLPIDTKEKLHAEWDEKSNTLKAMKKELLETCIRLYGNEHGYATHYQLCREPINRLHSNGISKEETAKKVAKYILTGSTAEYNYCDAFDFEGDSSMVNHLAQKLTELKKQLQMAS